MRKVQAGLPTMWLFFIVLLLCFVSTPVFSDSGIVPLPLQDTPFHLKADFKLSQHDFISDSQQGQSNRYRLIWEPWIGLASMLVGMYIVSRHQCDGYVADGIPTARDIVLVCMHDLDGKK